MSNLICLLNERRLAGTVANGSSELSRRLAAHVDRCAGCRQAWEELRALRQALSERPPAAPPSARFEARLWERLQSAPAQRGRIALWIPAAAMATAAACFLVWALLPGRDSVSPVAAVVVARRAVEGGRNPSVVRKAPAPDHRLALAAQGVRSLPTSSNHPRRRHHLRRRAAPRLVMARNVPLARHPSATTVARAQAPAASDAGPGTWIRLGAWYEAGGNYDSAEAAYSAAYAREPDPALAYRAGRAAESAGDVAAAIGYYARALTGPAPSAGTQKGSMRWTDDGTSA